MKSPQEMLAELEDQFILGEILESEYREKKRELIKQLRDRGETVNAEGSVQVAEVMDSRNVPFCHIPAGPFYFGPMDEDKEIKCAYYISKYPVTVREFREFLENSDIEYSDEDYETLSLVSPDDDCPASHLSYDDAKEFCRWLRSETGEYYSLPHEIEWERAARGEDGRFYPWGNEPPSYEDACFQGDMQYSCTIPVVTFEQKNRSPFGCVDMVGNVWEWCLDTFEDPRDPHILRGGSWCNDIDYTNCVARTFSFPSSKRIDYGGLRIIYLPGDMLATYREAYAERDAAKNVGLTVVSLKKEEAPAGAPSEKLKSLAQELDAAAARAANEGESLTATHTPKMESDGSVNDAMAAAISNAANMFLRKSSTESAMPTGTKDGTIPSIRVERKKPASTPAPPPPGGAAGPKYKSIEELRQERQEARQEKEGQELEFEEDTRVSLEHAKPLELPPAATYVAVAAWFILLFAVIGAFVYKLSQ